MSVLAREKRLVVPTDAIVVSGLSWHDEVFASGDLYGLF